MNEAVVKLAETVGVRSEVKPALQFLTPVQIKLMSESSFIIVPLSALPTENHFLGLWGPLLVMGLRLTLGNTLLYHLSYYAKFGHSR